MKHKYDIARAIIDSALIKKKMVEVISPKKNFQLTQSELSKGVYYWLFTAFKSKDHLRFDFFLNRKTFYIFIFFYRLLA